MGKSYFYAESKRALGLISFVLAMTVLLCAVFAFVAGAFTSLNLSLENKKIYRVGVVAGDDLGGSYLGVGLAAIRALDSSKLALSLDKMTLEEAKGLLDHGGITAYVIIPDDFVESLTRSSGISPITVVTTGSTVAITTLFKEELLSAIETYIIESQNGIFGLHALMDDAHIESKRYWAHDEKITLSYISSILQRNSIYRTEVIGVSDSLPMTGMILCGLFTLFLLLWGLSCCPLFLGKQKAFERLLAARGVGAGRQILCEYAVYFLLFLVCLLAAIIPTALLAGGGEYLTLRSFFLLLLPVAALSGLHFFLYEAAEGPVSAILSQFVTAIALAYLGGCFYPINFFPKPIVRLSAFLPSGMAREVISSIVSGANISLLPMLGLLVWTLLFFALSVLFRKRSLEVTA